MDAQTFKKTVANALKKLSPAEKARLKDYAESQKEDNQ